MTGAFAIVKRAPQAWNDKGKVLGYVAESLIWMLGAPGARWANGQCGAFWICFKIVLKGPIRSGHALDPYARPPPRQATGHMLPCMLGGSWLPLRVYEYSGGSVTVALVIEK